MAGRERFCHAAIQLGSGLSQGAASPYYGAKAAADAGDLDGALTYLTAAVEQRERAVVQMAVEPRFAPVRTDPRFQQLLGRVRPES